MVEIGQLTEVIGTVRKDVCDEKMTWTIEVITFNYFRKNVDFLVNGRLS